MPPHENAGPDFDEEPLKAPQLWKGGVAALVGGAPLARELGELVRRELILRRQEARVAGEMEYQFRHALVREAAYGMLTERDRRVGHALAGDWLEQVGGADPMTLAEHFEIGGASAQAADAYLRAAEDALRGSDLATALERADRGIGCGAAGETAGRLRRVQAEAHGWSGNAVLAIERGHEAIQRLEHGSIPWFSAINEVINASFKSGRLDEVERWTTAATGAPVTGKAEHAKLSCLANGAAVLILGGRYAEGVALLETVERASARAEVPDLEVIGYLHEARSYLAMCTGDLSAGASCTEAAVIAFEQAGDRRCVYSNRANLGFVYAELGDFERAESVLRAAMDEADRLQIHDLKVVVMANLAQVVACRGQVSEARALAETAATSSRKVSSPRAELISRSCLARIALVAGDLQTAEREARAAVALSPHGPTLGVQASAVLAGALLALGRIDEAVRTAAEANATLEAFGTLEEGESLVRLTFAEVLAACGRRDEALVAIESARTALLARAEKLSDPTWRERFLRDVPDNARTLELARQWLGS
ncbi:tetratricopeptide repeat protein [Sorangium sp. So ce269]